MDMANATSLKHGSSNLQLTSISKNKDPELDEYDPFDHREVEHPLT